jgi:two-component system, LytTR family, response regulator
MTMSGKLLCVYLVDDEALALKRLYRLLRETERVEIIGSTTSALSAQEFLAKNPVDAVFLDIQMPDLTGFGLLSRLPIAPAVVFTTAYDQYALNAFAVNAVDYLLKPVDAQDLDRALTRLERLRETHLPERIASRLGDRVVFIELDEVTHFYAKDKLTFAATESKDYVVDRTISELEQKLNPAHFMRIHRSTLVNLRYVKEMHSWMAGGLVVRLRNGKQTELQVARDRVPEVRRKMGSL